MAEVVAITKSLLDSLAQHINTKAGTTGLKTIAQMQDTVDGIAAPAAPVTYSQVNTVAAEYLANVTYNPDDYTTSEIESYANQTTTYRKDQPFGVDVAVKSGDLLATDALDGVLRKTVAAGTETLYNLAPMTEGADYVVQQSGVVSGSGHLTPTGSLRMIAAPSVVNVRDLGGWPCDGGTIKYGKLFRGGALAAAAHDVLVDQCGVRVDLDLRGTTEAGRDSSPLGDDVTFVCPQNIVWYSLAEKDTWREILRCIFDNVSLGRAVYYHCAAGADRTGTVSCILELLLGVAQSNVDKDYELTSFAGAGYLRKRTYATGNNTPGANWVGLINAIAALDGPTMRDKAVTFVASLGFTAEEINAFRAAMIDGTPETVTPSINTYTVTNALTNATSDNAAASATEYQPYTAKITPANGYAISAVQVKMGGVDVTGSVWSGTETVLRRKVTYDLTHCSSNNTRKAVIDGQGYAATLLADTGYTLVGASVTITMGGVDVSTYYKDGIIAIPQVTGDLEITVTAVKSAVPYTNQIPISTDADGSVYNNGLGYNNAHRINSSGNVAAEESGTPSVCTGFIPVKAGDLIRFSGKYIEGTSGGQNTAFYDAQRAKLNYNFTPYSFANTPASSLTQFLPYNYDADAHRLYSFTAPNDASIAYMRVTLAATTGEGAIITVNEEIV